MQSVADIQEIADYFTQQKSVFYYKQVPAGKKIRVLIYIRVSTKMQETRFSLKGQIQELISYAESMGWVIIGIYRDVDSGGKLDKAGLTQLLDDVDDDKGDVVLCIDQDRISRLDTVSWEYLKSQLRENSVKLAEPGKLTDLADEDDEFFADLKNLFARREKKKIVKRMMRGKRQRTREGKGWGKAAWEYNYDKNTGAYSVNEKHAWIIPFIDNLYLGEEGLSDSAIAERLNDITKTPTGKDWHEQHIRQRLTSKMYHGVLEKNFGNGETITVKDVYPQLRTEETWLKIQAKRKSKYQRRAPVYPHILREIETTCGHCGKKLSLKQSGTKNNIHYYFQHGTEYKATYSNDCGLSINSIRIEFNFVKALKDILRSEETAKRYIQFDYGQTDIDKLSREIDATNKLLQAVQGKLDSLLDLYLDGSFSKDVLNSKKDGLEKERDLHNTTLRQLEAKRSSLANNQFNYSTVYKYLAVAERFEVMLTENEKMEMVGTLFPSGVLYEDRYVLQGNMAGVMFEAIIPVAENPFEFMNHPGKKKTRQARQDAD
ncbi:recombinase family protein [Paenibacillus sp. MMO-177]|uniref:recombinase family protein n=1 Tax=Paenibacillus sp. MMO-177 TaxID=3081289 RepID=UPI00301ADA6B